MFPTRRSLPLVALLATWLCAVSLPQRSFAESGSSGNDSERGRAALAQRAVTEGASPRDLYEKGRAALASGDDPTAIDAFRLAADAVPGWVHPRLELAELAVKRREGVTDARRALGVFAPSNPDLLRLHRLLGELAELDGDDEATAASFTRAIELAPFANGSFYEKRAIARARLGQHEEAVGDFREALRRLPDELHLRARLADSLEAAGRKDEARKELEALVRLQPDRESPVRRLARFLERTGDASGARAMHAKADRLRSSPPRPTRDLRPLLPSRR